MRQGNEFANFMGSENIHHVFTTVDYPESNDVNERVNQSLVNHIRCRINESANSTPWASIPHKCVAEYNGHDSFNHRFFSKISFEWST